MSQTERGKEARRYFIACEEKLKELADQLVQILFNYASCVNEETLECFKNDVDTINLLYQEITKI